MTDHSSTASARRQFAILSDRLAVLSQQDVESRERTQSALNGLRAMIHELESIEFGE